MILALRYANAGTAAAYPLECHGQLDWQVSANKHKASIKLPEIPAGAILVPSLSLLSDDDYKFQFVLKLGSHRWPLHPVPCDSAPESEPNAAVSTHIDCFHVHEDLHAPELEIEIVGLRHLTDYLLTATARPLELTEIPAPSTNCLCAAPPAITQKSAGSKLGPRVCSPTCIAMLLKQFGKEADLWAVSAACFDPTTKLYGIWPLALRAASREGCLGAVEVFDDWRDPQHIIEAGVPLVASIRFATGGLPDAPLTATGGHLVVLHGIGPEEVRVCDPAAARTAVVPRVYDTPHFGRAWLEHRGAAYILLP
ncbi:MAG: C39 family peptidase [Pseudomonadales bacterium]